MTDTSHLLTIVSLLDEAKEYFLSGERGLCATRVLTAIMTSHEIATMVALAPLYHPLLTAVQEYVDRPSCTKQHILKFMLMIIACPASSTMVINDPNHASLFNWIYKTVEALESVVHVIRTVHRNDGIQPLEREGVLTEHQLYHYAGMLFARLTNTNLTYRCMFRAITLLREGD